MNALLLALLGAAPQATSYATGVTIHEPASAHPGLNIEISDLEAYHTLQPQEVRVRDMDGGLVHTWTSPWPEWNIGELAKPLSGGRILTILYDKVDLADRVLAEMDWDGNVLWVYDPTSTPYDIHHDFERLADGRTVVITHRVRSAPGVTSGNIWDDVIHTVSPEGVKLDEWSAYAHFFELGLSSETVSTIAALPAQGTKDIFHMNSIQSLPPNRHEATDPRFEAGNILVSVRSLNRVFVYDDATGQVVWINPVPTIGQHHARLIPGHLPGAGNILVFDNGGKAGYPTRCRLYSRVLEIDPVLGKIVWKYDTQDAPPNSALRRTFFSNRISGAQRLPNGNTLICQGDWGRLFEVEPDGTIVWEFMKTGYKKLYRGYRVDPSWPTGTLPSWTW